MRPAIVVASESADESTGDFPGGIGIRNASRINRRNNSCATDATRSWMMIAAGTRPQGILESTGVSMPRRNSFVLAGIVAGVAIGAASDAAARQVHGGDVARVLAGKAFHILCVDGTRGRGEFSQTGAVTVSYRRPNGSPLEHDRAVVRVKGVEICLAWRQFGGGGDGCYPVHQQSMGTYRLGNGPIWCDITAREPAQARDTSQPVPAAASR
jgi:hypothetical protein